MPSENDPSNLRRTDLQWPERDAACASIQAAADGLPGTVSVGDWPAHLALPGLAFPAWSPVDVGKYRAQITTIIRLRNVGQPEAKAPDPEEAERLAADWLGRGQIVGADLSEIDFGGRLGKARVLRLTELGWSAKSVSGATLGHAPPAYRYVILEAADQPLLRDAVIGPNRPTFLFILHGKALFADLETGSITIANDTSLVEREDHQQYLGLLLGCRMAHPRLRF